MTTEIQLPNISLRELEQRWGLSRNGLKARAKALGVDLLRVSSTLTVWPGDYIDLGDRLDEHLKSGQPMGTFPGIAPSSASTASSSLARSASDEAAIIAKTIAACSFSLPAADPLRRAKALAEAADNALVLTTDELVALGVKGIASFANGDLAYGYCFIKHEQRNRVLWMVERCFAAPAGSAKALPASKQNKQVGFASCLTISAISLPMFNC